MPGESRYLYAGTSPTWGPPAYERQKARPGQKLAAVRTREQLERMAEHLKMLRQRK